jgi:hypothetical protein
MSTKNSKDIIGNRTRDLPAYSEVPQPTVPTRAPENRFENIKWGLIRGKLKKKRNICGSATVAVVCALWVGPNLRVIRGRSGRRWAFKEVLIEGKHCSEMGASASSI